MPQADDVYIDLRERVRELARDMVRLEMEARRAYWRNDFVRVGDLHSEREQVQQHRSELLRQVWQMQRRRRFNYEWRMSREALRQARV